MDIDKFGRLMAERGVCIRAIPNSVRMVVEAQHVDKYPDGKIVFLPDYKREMLVVERVPKCAGQFMVKAGVGTTSAVDFAGCRFYRTFGNAVDALMKGSDGQ